MMFTSKKSFALVMSFLFLSQQFSFAAAVLKTQEETPLSTAAMMKLENFNKKTRSSWQIRMNHKSGTPRSLVNGEKMRAGNNEGSVRSFLKSNADFLGVDRNQLKLKLQRKSAVGNHFYFDQYYQNLKVENAYVKVNVNSKGELINYQSTYVKDLNININPAKSVNEAASAATSDLGGGDVKGSELLIYSEAEGADAKLAWKIQLVKGDTDKWDYFVDANTGAVLNKVSRLMRADTVKAQLNPVYPGFSTPVYPNLDTTQVPLANLTVNYFNTATTVASATTNAAGVSSPARAADTRLFFNFSGPYFSVADQGTLDGYYIELGDNGGSVEPISLLWDSFSTGQSQNPSSVQTYSACPTGTDYPFFGSPAFTDFAVGDMVLFSGAIKDKVFLDASVGGKVLGKYIGKMFSPFMGPIVPNLSNVQSISFAINPSTRTGSYKVETVQRLCAPKTISTGYSQISTHLTTSASIASANVFYNLNAMRDYFKALDTGNYINLDNHLPVIVNAFGRSYPSGQSGMINAFYDLDQKVIMYGQGEKESGGTAYKNFALESGIVRHEYVHAVVDNIWPIMYFDQGAAVSEAVADYFALSSIVDPSGDPLTSEIGTFVALSTSTGEGAARNLDGTSTFDPLTWAANGAEGQHANSLVLSQALWKIRTNATTKANADKIVWTALMFFPDSLLEFRDAVIASASALGLSSYIPTIEAAFNAHGITYSNIITPNGDIYEPNNGPESAANVDIASIGKKELKATINPVSDIDYFSISLPPGAFEVTLTMPQAPTANPVTYYPLAMILLDANLKTVVDVVLPNMSGGQHNITTPDKTVKLTYEVPSKLDGNTGRYILGIFKPEAGAYPTVVTDTTGAYTLNFKFTEGSNIGGVTTIMDDFENGKQISFSAPFTTYGNTNNSSIPGGLTDWAPNRVEAFHSVRLLDRDLQPLDSNYLNLVGAVTYDTVNSVITGTVEFANNFADLGHNTVYIQVFGKLRTNASAPTPPSNPSNPDEYGVVSLGISEPIRNKVSSGQTATIRNSIFNPDKGVTMKLEINAQKDGKVKAQVFTLDGLPVKILYEGDMTVLLPKFVEWDGKNTNGTTVASGVYILRIDGAGIDKQLKKIVVVR